MNTKQLEERLIKSYCDEQVRAAIDTLEEVIVQDQAAHTGFHQDFFRPLRETTGNYHSPGRPPRSPLPK